MDMQHGMSSTRNTPSSAFSGQSSGRNIHDAIAKLEEGRGVQRLGKEVGEIFLGGNVAHVKHTVFDHLSNEEVATIYVLGALVVLRVVAQIDSRFVVY